MDIEQEIKNIKDRLKHVETVSSVAQQDIQIREIRDLMYDIKMKLSHLESSVKALEKGSYIEIVSDEELVSLNIESGLKAEDIVKEFKLKSQEDASEYICGKVKDLMARHRLKRIYIKKILSSSPEKSTIFG